MPQKPKHLERARRLMALRRKPPRLRHLRPRLDNLARPEGPAPISRNRAHALIIDIIHQYILLMFFIDFITTLG